MKNVLFKKVSYITAFLYTALIAASMFTTKHVNGVLMAPKMVETLKLS